MGEEEKKKNLYGTFQGQQYAPPSIGFPQPIPPPGASVSAGTPYFPPPPGHQGYQGYQGHQGYQPPIQGNSIQGYQPIQGYAVVEGRPIRERRLPCCGIGFGWLLFILGFFVPAIPWYAGAIVILFGQVDYREKPGFIACTIAAVLATIALLLGVTQED